MINENNEIVFPYQVNTIMPIIGLSCGDLMVPTTAKLTKEDVLICLKKAPVFRRFSSSKLERVTISNLDRLHNEEFMTEAEYEAFLDKQGDVRGKVAETPVVEEKKETEPVKVEVEEEPVPVVEEAKVETVTEESVVEEAETVEETAQTEDTIEEEVTENINDEKVSEDVTEEAPEVVEETNSDENHRNNRYNNKKKHNR
jgi:hypothetical protein